MDKTKGTQPRPNRHARRNNTRLPTEMKREDYDQAQNDAEAARDILIHDRFNFLRKILKAKHDSIKSDILNNRVHKMVKTVSHTDIEGSLQQTSEVIEQAETMDELSGQYKLIDELFTTLDAIEKAGAKLKKDVDNGFIKIQE